MRVIFELSCDVMKYLLWFVSGMGYESTHWDKLMERSKEDWGKRKEKKRKIERGVGIDKLYEEREDRYWY